MKSQRVLLLTGKAETVFKQMALIAKHQGHKTLGQLLPGLGSLRKEGGE